jgi:hypothetical protein|tara:strand:+ start:620 stop:892 length:273 start_codon:yes stop_codon:yes gene_type:complete
MNLDKAEKFLKSKGVDTEKYVIHDIKGEYLPQIPIALWLEEFAQERVESNVVLDAVNEPFYCDIIEGEEGYRCKEQCMSCRSIEDKLTKQ